MERSAFLILYPTKTNGLPCFTPYLPTFTLMAPITGFYPVLEGKMCRGKKEGKTALYPFYPRVKTG